MGGVGPARCVSRAVSARLAFVMPLFAVRPSPVAAARAGRRTSPGQRASDILRAKVGRGAPRVSGAAGGGDSRRVGRSRGTDTTHRDRAGVGVDPARRGVERSGAQKLSPAARLTTSVNMKNGILGRIKSYGDVGSIN